MALDKQRILSELGSVMNQLQSADCGCMGKLFSPGQGGCGGAMGHPLPTCGGCRRGCCPGHGMAMHHNMPGAGEPFAMNAGGMGAGGMPGGMQGGMPGGMQGGMPGGMQGGLPEGMPGGMSRGMPGGMSGGMPGGMHGGMPGGMFERHNGMQSGGMFGGMKSGGMPCGMNMGGNAPKLYADTYSYLNKNLMQPIVQDVYNELKTITPENTIASNPLAAQMGLGASAGNPGGNPGAMGGQMASGGMDMGGAAGNPMTAGSHNMPQMGGMGANIVNMMMGGGGGKPKGGQFKDAMLIDAPHSPHGQIGLAPLGDNMTMSGMNPGTGMNPGGAPNESNMGGIPVNRAMGQGDPSTMMQHPPTQYVNQDNMFTVNAMQQGNEMPQGNMNPQGNIMPQGNMPPQGNVMTPGHAMQQGNVTPQQGNAMPLQGNVMPQQGNLMTQGNVMTGNTPGMMNMRGQPGQSPYGIHSAGIKKFNEMFPGVMQGDLDFDPMAIAVQMNPANQKRAAMDTITKLMSGNKGQAMLQSSLTGVNAAAQQLQSQGGQAVQGQPQMIPAAQGGQQQLIQGQQQMTPGQQQMTPGQQQMIPGQQQVIPGQQQQVYSSLTRAPVMNQQQMQGQENLQGQIQQQIDPATGEAITEGMPVDPNAPQGTAPVPGHDNTVAYNATPQYQFNTLGQPVHMLPGDMYQKPMPGLPQTVDGKYRGNYNPGLGVKNTLSKTAIAGTLPVGATASRSQLKHIYRQYKASHSATQQNIRPPVMQVGSASVGNLNVPSGAPPPMQQIPVEKVAGDTIANNPQQPKLEQVIEQVGGTPHANTPRGDATEGIKTGRKGRNGIQDLAFGPYRATGGWSFHG